jgi:cytochrome P450
VHSLTATIDRLFRRDPAFLADPYPVYHDLRRVASVLRVDGSAADPPWLNAWHVFAYTAVASCLRDERVSSQRHMAAMPLEHFGIDPTTPAARFFWTIQAQTMLTMDASDHTRLRRLVLKAFTPRVVERMRDDIQGVIDLALATLRRRYPGLRLALASVEWRRDGAIRGPQSLLVTAG